MVLFARIATLGLLGLLTEACHSPRSGSHVDGVNAPVVVSATSASTEIAAPLGSVAPPAPSSSGDLVSPTVQPPWVHENLAVSAAACPREMNLVDGIYCPFADHICSEWIDQVRDRCARYASPPLCEGKKEKKHFCIDRYEYPNLVGVRPAVMVNWFEAKATCELEGKRLCTSSEWTLACEGEEILPFPYGYVRDTTMCNIDQPRPVPEPDFEAFSHPRRISAEVSRLDLRTVSGGKPFCVSPYGVFDLTGNVDEWVVNEDHFLPPRDGKPPPFISGLKGGYWGPIRARCRPITPSHNEWFRFYQVGFRCCAETVEPDEPSKE